MGGEVRSFCNEPNSLGWKEILDASKLKGKIPWIHLSPAKNAITTPSKRLLDEAGNVLDTNGGMMKSGYIYAGLFEGSDHAIFGYRMVPLDRFFLVYSSYVDITQTQSRSQDIRSSW